MTRSDHPAPDAPRDPAPSGADGSPGGSGRGDRRANQLGIVLVALGALALLANLGVFGGLDGLLGGLLFAAGGVFFIRLYRRRDHTWALPVGFGLFALAAAAIADGPLSGPYFLGLLGAGFVALHWDDHRRWWALIPGGILLTLGVVAAVDELLPVLDAGPVLFLGIAATFFWLTRLERTPQPWAIYPALGALAVGILSLSFTGGWLFPLLLVGAGAWLLRRGDLGRLGELFERREGASAAAAPAGTPDRAPEDAAPPAPASSEAAAEPATVANETASESSEPDEQDAAPRS